VNLATLSFTIANLAAFESVSPFFFSAFHWSNDVNVQFSANINEMFALHHFYATSLSSSIVRAKPLSRMGFRLLDMVAILSFQMNPLLDSSAGH
jgi:hypothetical protein